MIVYCMLCTIAISHMATTRRRFTVAAHANIPRNRYTFKTTAATGRRSFCAAVREPCNYFVFVLSEMDLLQVEHLQGEVDVHRCQRTNGHQRREGRLHPRFPVRDSPALPPQVRRFGRRHGAGDYPYIDDLESWFLRNFSMSAGEF